MTEAETNGARPPEPAAEPPSSDGGEAVAPPDERKQSTTVGTGSYVALSCTVMALAATFVILGILFLLRWL